MLINDFLEAHNINDEVYAVGVSGGADSLALAFMLAEWAKLNRKKIIALTVNHGLRPSALKEAEYVASKMSKIGVEHHILTWEGVKPSSGIETAARAMRYKLLEEWCLEHNINKLFIAHHKNDQAETFLMRLQRGSGIDGLCGIAEVSKLGNLQLLRPLLNTTHDELKSYLMQKNIKWVEDESNNCDDFLRVRARKLLPILEDVLGLDIDRIVNTMTVLSNSRSYLEEQALSVIKNNVKKWENAGVSLSLKSFSELHQEMRYRVLSKLISLVGNKAYAPEGGEVLRLIENLTGEKVFRGSTLGDCEILVSQGKIWIVPELKIKDKPSKKTWEEFVERNPQYKKITIPYKLRLSLMLRHPI